MRSGLQVVEGVVKFINPAFLQRRFALRDGRFYFRSYAPSLFTIFVESLLHLIDEPIKPVARFDLFALLRVVRGMRFGITHHLVYLVLVQTGRRRDRYLLF